MSLQKSLKEIKRLLLKRYKKNLAAILVFGSANTGHFVGGESDIDHMIFLKRLHNLNLTKESKFLFENLRKYHFSTQYFNTLKGIKEYIKKRKSFSTYVTIVSDDGSRIIYSTLEFEKTKEWLLKHPFKKQEIKDSIKEKDKFELEGYFREIKDYELTKGLMSHIKRKLQIMNYFKTGKLIFDYDKCIKNINPENKEELNNLYEVYKQRGKLSKKEIDYYYKLARELTRRINTQF